ncbi:MAG: hypothetical protein OES46_05370 [Gammaproteobacteria bacterium]|nr:hypothetical protein [Gammaproteobacteria bacterium]
MGLTLTAPDIVDSPATNAETNPSDLERRLSRLPLLNPVESSYQLCQSLSALNRTELDSTQRLQLLELYRVRIKQITHELQRQYIGRPLPLHERNKVAAEQTRQLQVEIAYGYKRIVLNSSQPHDSQSHQKLGPESLATAIQRAIRYLTEVIVKSYQNYTFYPEGTWREIHQLYTHAERIGIVDTRVDDPLNQTVRNSSIGHAYKQALLVELSDPYHLPGRMIEKIQRYLDRWASLVHLQPATTIYDPKCQFLIDQQSDRGGEVYTGEAEIQHPEQYRLLNTIDLAQVIHQQLSAMDKGHQPDPKGLEEDFFVQGGEDMLRRLINAWGINPKRYFPRKTIDDGNEMDVAIGIAAINYCINGGKEFVLSSNDHDTESVEITIASSRQQWLSFDESAQPSHTRWKLRDESASGFALAKHGVESEHVRVGDLVATRPPGEDDPWRIAVIRWMKSMRAIDMEIGMKRLAPTADPVAIKVFKAKPEEPRAPEEDTSADEGSTETHAVSEEPRDETNDVEDEEQNEEIESQAEDTDDAADDETITVSSSVPEEQGGDFLPALLLPRVRVLNQPQTLVTYRGTFKPDRLLLLDNGQTRNKILATKLVEITDTFERFQFMLAEESTSA